MGCSCNKHNNLEDGLGNVCQTRLDFVTRTETLAEAECVLRLKRWLVAGLDIARGPHSRTEHLKMRPRGFREGLSEEELDQIIGGCGAADPAGQKEPNHVICIQKFDRLQRANSNLL